MTDSIKYKELCKECVRLIAKKYPEPQFILAMVALLKTESDMQKMINFLLNNNINLMSRSDIQWKATQIAFNIDDEE